MLCSRAYIENINEYFYERNRSWVAGAPRFFVGTIFAQPTHQPLDICYDRTVQVAQC
jgi:hypothetical protein